MTYKIRSKNHNELVTGQLINALNRANEIVKRHGSSNRVRVIGADGITWFDSDDHRTMDQLLDDVY